MTIVMGIDGGGSAVRVVVCDSDLTVLGQSQGPTANPSLVGYETAAQAIRAAMRGALAQAGLDADRIAAVGIGVAGAAGVAFKAWLREAIRAVTPQALPALSADYEIALVGAHGRRCGVLVLAGTGSLSYGVNAAGDAMLAGGWGYLLGDEGSGYWLGREGMRAAIHALEGRGPDTSLREVLFTALGLESPRDLIPRLYGSQTAVREIAALAPVVMGQARGGDPVAAAIVTQAAEALAGAASAVIRRLHMESAPIAFAGGLLSAPTPLREKLCAVMGIPCPPESRYPPVIGAAILALDAIKAGRSAGQPRG